MRAEAERHRINDAVGHLGDIDLFSLGVVLGFGGPAPQEPPVASPPPTAMPEPMPAPGDIDHDGVSDDIDKCPGTPRGVAVDGAGCPLKGSITLEGVDSNDTDAGRARNRRVVMDVITNPGEVKIEGEGSAQ